MPSPPLSSLQTWTTEELPHLPCLGWAKEKGLLGDSPASMSKVAPSSTFTEALQTRRAPLESETSFSLQLHAFSFSCKALHTPPHLPPTLSSESCITLWGESWRHGALSLPTTKSTASPSSSQLSSCQSCSQGHWAPYLPTYYPLPPLPSFLLPSSLLPSSLLFLSMQSNRASCTCLYSGLHGHIPW